MRICFVANYSKTYLFDEIGKKLRESTGAEICWIVVNRKLCDYLLKSYPSEQVLYLDKSFINKATEPVGEFCINEIIYGDRALRHSMGDAVKYLTHIQKPISDFIQQNNIKVFFGEHTWAHELLIERLAASISIPYLDPQVVRIPNGRF